MTEYVKPVLKEKGFRKKAKRWIKETEHYTYLFYIQGSAYDKDDYYVRPGIIIKDIQAEPWGYGHICTDIPVTTKEDVLSKALEFFAEWSDIEQLKKSVAAFIEWEKRNPVEKRREGKVDYEADPVPSKDLFSLSEKAKQQIMNL